MFPAMSIGTFSLFLICLSLKTDHKDPATANGMFTMNTKCQLAEANSPPAMRPISDPVMKEIWLIPSALPLSVGPKESVMSAVLFTISRPPPTA